jgi:hypothetical protein
MYQGFLALILLTVLVSFTTAARGTNGIKNNGHNAIWIDIYSSPFTTLAEMPICGQYAYGPSGCAWFASARQWQITGNNPGTIYSGLTWWNTAYSRFGYGRDLGTAGEGARMLGKSYSGCGKCKWQQYHYQ